MGADRKRLGLGRSRNMKHALNVADNSRGKKKVRRFRRGREKNCLVSHRVKTMNVQARPLNRRPAKPMDCLPFP